TNKIKKSWDIRELSSFLKRSPNQHDWRKIYFDVPFRTEAEVKESAQNRINKTAREVKILKIFLMLWLAVIPAGYAIFELLGPQ
ncbi:hypothetical protein R0K05_22995, partial [Planococcus sp. SIMBA_160]